MTTLNGRYRLERRISRTEMAEVYEAVDETLERPVAVKVLLRELADDPDFVTRFQREARAAAILNHPNIVSVYDSGQYEGQWYIVMEFVDGPTLAELIRDDAPLPETRAAEIGMEIAAALAAAHQQGIVHRDVKPGNVLLGSGGVVKVVDFGIARALESNTDLTRPGTIVGSVSYLSPEQAMGEVVGPESDVYSLGTVLYAMVTGAPPFSGENAVSIAHQHVHEPPVPPTAQNPELSPAFDALILRMLAKDPADRPASAEAVRQELLDIVEGATAPEATSSDATAVMAPPPPVPAGGSTRVLTTAQPSAAAGVRPQRNAALVATIAVLTAIAAIVLVALLANAVRGHDTSTTTIPTTIPTTTTSVRRIVPTTPRTSAPATTAAPATTEFVVTVPPTEPQPTSPPPQPTPTTAGF